MNHPTDAELEWLAEIADGFAQGWVSRSDDDEAKAALPALIAAARDRNMLAQAYADRVAEHSADNARHVACHTELLATISRLQRELEHAKNKAFNAHADAHAQFENWKDATGCQSAPEARRCIGELREKLAALRGPHVAPFECHPEEGT